MSQAMGVRWPLVIGLALSGVASAPSAQAQEEYEEEHEEELGEQSQQAYPEAIEAAVAAYQAGLSEEAYAHFQRAHELQPGARTERGMGLSALRVGDLPRAIPHLQAALAEGRQALPADLRADVQQLLQDAETRVARVAIEFTAEGELLLDDQAPARDSTSGELLLLPGAHVLSLHREQDVRTVTIAVVAGERRTLGSDDFQDEKVSQRQMKTVPAEGGPEPVMTTAAGVAKATPRTEQPPPVGESSLLGQHLGPLLLASGGAAALIGAAVTGSLASSAEADLDDRCNTDGGCDSKERSLKNRGMALQDATNGLLAVGAGALLGSALWWWLSSDDGGDAPLTLACGADRCALHLRGEL